MKIYPLEHIAPLERDEMRLMIPCLEGLIPTPEQLTSKQLLSLEFCWVPTHIADAYRQTGSIEELWSHCPLNCKGCFAKQPALFQGHDPLYPAQIFELIKEAVAELGTRTIKYLGPTEFFRDPEVFAHLDRFAELGVTLSIFAKDPLLGTDPEFVERISQYPNLRILFNFSSFDDQLTNQLVQGGHPGVADRCPDYKSVQTRALKLLYEHFVQRDLERGRAPRLVVVNSLITPQTIGEAWEIYRYFTERGVVVCSTTSMQSGCGRQLYRQLDESFLEQFAQFYAQTLQYAVQHGLLTAEYVEQYGPSPFPGNAHCYQMCNGLIIRETGQLMRCPGADHEEWRDQITPQQLLEKGLAWAWPQTRNYQQPPAVDCGCLAKPAVFTPQFNQRVMEIYHGL